MSEKSEKPTTKRLADARKKGQFARSRVLSSTGATLGGLVGLAWVGPSAWTELSRLTSAALSLELATDTAVSAFSRWALSLLLVPATLALAGAAGPAVAFAGLQFRPGELTPKLERLSPAKGLTKLFSLRQLKEVAFGALALAAVLGLSIHFARENFERLLPLPSVEAAAGLEAVGAEIFDFVLGLAVFGLGLGAVHYAWQRHEHERGLRMSKDEVKREYKESEGDPHHKAHRKAAHRQLAQGGAARGLQKASVVVVNPTHIAVALRYDSDETEAPYIVAKAREEDALALRKQAKSLGIPVVKDIPLARSLIHFDVGEAVPEELYEAAAAVLKVALSSTPVDAPPGVERL